jgi:ParB-like chromosome segregation protein Spo0J
MDDEEAEMASLTENLFRNELSPAQKTLSVQRWQELFAAKHPESLTESSTANRTDRGFRSYYRV